MQSTFAAIKLKSDRLRRALKDRGFKSYKQLAEAAGVHRNTVSDYLSGSSKPLPDGLERLLITLKVDPQDALETVREAKQVPAASLAALTDRLLPLMGQSCLILFGSRARGRPKKHSDYDLGIFSKVPVPFEVFSRMLTLVSEWNESSPAEVQLTNLSLADREFIKGISKDAQFITGSLSAWKAFLELGGLEAYE